MQKQQPRLDPKRLVFIDETSVSTTITRLYGRAPQGERLVQKVPHGNWKTITFIAALRHDRVTAPFVLEGPMTGEMFKAYTEQFLAPTLTRGDIVFMDNVSVHKVDGIEEAIEARGAMRLVLRDQLVDARREPAVLPQQLQHQRFHIVSERINLIRRHASLNQPAWTISMHYSRVTLPQTG